MKFDTRISQSALIVGTEEIMASQQALILITAVST